MGIRDVSYYGWNDILVYRPTDISGSSISLSASFIDMDADSSGNFFVSGNARLSTSVGATLYWFILRSQDYGNNWQEVFLSKSNDSIFVGSLVVDNRDCVFVGGHEFAGQAA